MKFVDDDDDDDDRVVRHSLAYLAVQKWLVGNISLYVKIWPKLTHPLQICVFPTNIRL